MNSRVLCTKNKSLQRCSGLRTFVLHMGADHRKIRRKSNKVLNSISKSALVDGSLTHSSLFFSKAFCVSFRPHCMCLTRLGLLFSTSQPEHSKNKHTHTHSNTQMLQTKAVTLSRMNNIHTLHALMAVAHTIFMCTHMPMQNSAVAESQ